MNDTRVFNQTTKKYVTSLPQTPMQYSPYVYHEAKASGVKFMDPQQPNCFNVKLTGYTETPHIYLLLHWDNGNLVRTNHES